MPSKARDLTGERFGRWTVIQRAENSKAGMPRYIVRCDCGNEKIVSYSNLAQGRSRSCGCLKKEIYSSRTGGASYNYKHGGKLHSERLYRIWKGMKQRCLNPNTRFYSAYGGRGITVCGEWLHDYPAFRDWAMNNGYSDDLTIDRINNDAGYSPDNCRWATWKQQNGNRRPPKRKKKAPMNLPLPQLDS